MENKLKPCPFCGVILDKLECGWEHPQTFDCILGAVDRHDNPLYISHGEEEKWNRRVDNEAD